MQLLVSLTLVVALATALQFIQTTGIPPNALSALASAPIDQPSTQAAGAIENAKEAVSDQVANKQCPKPQVKNGVQEIYNSTKPLEQPYTENGKKYYNLFGKNCVGPFIDSFCSKENFCDAKTFANSLCFFDGKWQACKTPAGVQVASNNNGTVCDACQTSVSDLSKDATPPPVQSESPVTGNQQLKDAYTASPATAPVSPASGITTKPTAAQQLNTLAGAPSTGSVGDTSVGSVRKAVYIPPPQSAGVALAPTSPASGGSVGPIRPAGPTGLARITQPTLPPTAQNTFSRPTFKPPTQPTGESTGSRFSKFFSNFSIQSLFSGVTNLMTNAVTKSTSKQTTVMQDTAVVRAQQPVFVPTTQTVPRQDALAPVIVPGPERTSIQYPGNLGVSSTTFGRLSDDTSVSARDIGTAVRIDIQRQDDPLSDDLLKDGEAEGPREVVRVTSTVAVSTSHVPTPTLFVNTASSTPENIRQAFIEKATSLSTVFESDFRPASTTQRASSIVELFSAISIPEIFTSLAQAPIDFFRRILGRGVPDVRIVTTDYVQPPVSSVKEVPAPPFEGTPGTRATSEIAYNGSSTGPADTLSTANTREDVARRLEKEPDVAFRDVSPAYQGDGYVPLSRPGNIYPDVVPVPVRREAASTAPGFLELVVKNGAVELKKLFTTIWHIILPPRE